MENGNIILNKKNYLPIAFDEKGKKQIYSLFISILFEYLRSFKTIVNEKSKIYSISVIKKGISMLKNVMNVLFIYTRNINMIHIHLNKSFLYYIEFIEQIGEEGNSFLQLSSKDAVLFVYKKTLFDINTEYKKNMKYTLEESNIINEILDSMNMFIFISEYVLFKDIKRLEDIDINTIEKKINKIIDKYIKKKYIENLNNNINVLFHHLILNKIDNMKALTILDVFLQKVKISTISNMANNLIKTELEKNINPVKYINKLLSKSK
jgi:hypothetical protein